MNAEHQADSDRPVCVVLDTNVWLSNPLLRTPLGAALLYALRRIEARIGMPEVIESEIVQNIVKRGNAAVEDIEQGFETIAVIIGERDDYHVPSPPQFESAARERLRELDDLLVRVPFSLEQAKSALDRVNAGTPPNGPKNQQFKDSVIWEAVLDLAHTYTVHFVTEDRAFFQDREPHRGLAANLRDDCAAVGGQVHAYGDLSTYLRSLQEKVPPLDTNPLRDAIDRAVITDLRQFAASKEFGIGPMVDAQITPFVTEQQNVLALRFVLRYEAIDETRSAYDAPQADTLVVEGSGLLDYPTQELTDVHLSGAQYTKPDGEVVAPRSIVYLRGVSHIGRRQIPHRFQWPIA